MEKNEKTTMKVSIGLRNKLMKMKYGLGCDNLEEVVERMLEIVNKFKLASELKGEEK